MKVKKRIMIALAGAMILGVFGTSGAPMMADESQGPVFMVTIPADLTITHTGMNEAAGNISMRASQPGWIYLCTDENEYDEGFRHLENQNVQDGSVYIEYQLEYNDGTYWYSLGPVKESFYIDDPQQTYQYPIGAYLNEEKYIDMDYIAEKMPPGEYKDVVTFGAEFEVFRPQN